MPTSRTGPPAVVLDTNLVLSALVFGSPRLDPLRQAWQSGRCVPLASTATTLEPMRVLHCPKFKLGADEQRELIADYLPHCRTVKMPARLPKLPICRDPDDQMFISLAAVGKAGFLLTGNKDLLVLSAQPGGRIVTAEWFLARLGA